MTTRWLAENSADDSQRYIERFNRLAKRGVDLHGESRFVDAVVAPASNILDAGCGTGRVGAELARRGHRVTGVELDPVLAAAARAQPELEVHTEDLTRLKLGRTFDAAVAAGNVLVFVEPGTEQAVLERIWMHLREDGVFVTGFATDRDYTVAELDTDLAAVGFVLEQRFATWDLRPWTADSDWAVTVARKPPRPV